VNGSPATNRTLTGALGDSPLRQPRSTQSGQLFYVTEIALRMCHSIYPPYSRREPFGPSEPSNSGIAQRCTSPTMPSADFCAAVGSPRGLPSPEFETRHRPPRLSLTTFLARSPDLQHWPLMDGGLRRLRSARPTNTAYYPIPVRQAATLLHTTFRRRVTKTPLRFANPSPPSSWIRDLHPQVEKHAWQTKKTGSELRARSR
jgi:hypothetical protein